MSFQVIIPSKILTWIRVLKWLLKVKGNFPKDSFKSWTWIFQKRSVASLKTSFEDLNEAFQGRSFKDLNVDFWKKVLSRSQLGFFKKRSFQDLKRVLFQKRYLQDLKVAFSFQFRSYIFLKGLLKPFHRGPFKPSKLTIKVILSLQRGYFKRVLSSVHFSSLKRGFL